MDLSLPSSPCPCNEDTQESALKSVFREQSLFDHRPGMEHVCVGLCGSLLWQIIKQKKLVLVLFHITSSPGINKTQFSFISYTDWQFRARANYWKTNIAFCY